MKKGAIHAAWRLLVLALGTLLLFAGSVLVLHVVSVMPPLEIQGTGISFALNLTEVTVAVGLLWGVSGLAGGLVGIMLLGLGIARTSDRGKSVQLNSPSTNGIYGGGRVTVTMESLHALASFAGQKVDGVREIEPRLRLRKDGWHIDCDAAVTPEAAIPDTVSRLRTALTEALEHHTGLPVARVDCHTQLGAIDARHRVR